VGRGAAQDGAGVDWSGAVFFRAGREGPVPDAKARLAALPRKLHEDCSLIRDGEFFNAEAAASTRGAEAALSALRPVG
jgi:hypothetical protein